MVEFLWLKIGALTVVVYYKKCKNTNGIYFKPKSAFDERKYKCNECTNILYASAYCWIENVASLT